tara:strand:+ start:685 stop:966 length:282 start_codon:yes stop_codon:yes gene_type:complete
MSQDLFRDAINWRKHYLQQSNQKPQILFSGFNKEVREELERIALANGLAVVKSVTKKLDYFVFGDNAGTKKIEQVLLQQVPSMGEQQFRHVLS